MKEIIKKCPFCHTETTVELTDEEYDNLEKFGNDKTIQEILPKRTKTEREVLISGLCKDCQRDVFGGK